MTYQHRFLTDLEKSRFTTLFQYNISRNILLSAYYTFPVIIVLFPILWVYLLYTSLSTSVTPPAITFFLCGFCALKLKFDFAHMFAHGLMLDYNLWNVKSMSDAFGDIASVIFPAFNHHHEDGSFWLRKRMFLSNVEYYSLIVFTHWESFSIFTQVYPFGTTFSIVSKILLVWCLKSNPNNILPFVLGHEFGVFLLPFSHDWVHARYISRFCYYPFKFLEILGIFATKEKHSIHHDHTHEFVYRSFSSSGIYSESLDKHLDELWEETHKKSRGLKYQAQVALLEYTLMIYSVVWIFMANIHIYS